MVRRRPRYAEINYHPRRAINRIGANVKLT
nr:MAG TPA: hypothetical protein [Caudoviricetes sp.]